MNTTSSVALISSEIGENLGFGGLKASIMSALGKIQLAFKRDPPPSENGSDGAIEVRAE